MASIGEFAGKAVSASSWKNIFKPSIDGAKGLVSKAEGKEFGLKPGFDLKDGNVVKKEGFGNTLKRHPFSTATGVGAAGLGGYSLLGGKKKEEGDSFTSSQAGAQGGAPPTGM